MRLIIENPSPVPVRRWVTVTAPRCLELYTLNLGTVGQAGPWKVVRGGEAGPGYLLHACLEDAAASMPPGLEARHSIEWTKDKELFGPVPEIPVFRITAKTTTEYGDEAHVAVTMGPGEWIHSDPVHSIFHARARLEPSSLVADLWIYAWHGQDVFEWELLLNMAHPGHAHLKEHVDLIAVDSRSFLWADDARATGYRNEGVRIVLARDIDIVDGQSIAAYGRALKPGYGWASLEEYSLLAELPHRMVGMVDAWRPWGPFGHDFGVSDPASIAKLRAHVIDTCRRHADHIAAEPAKDPWGENAFGCTKRPGGTGDQQGFGVAKMGEALIPLEPLFLLPARYSAVHDLACRPVLFREANGDPLQPGRHEGLVLWDERPHWHWDVSPNRLGKERNLGDGEASGWYGMDDQHYSPLFEVGAYALTGSRMIGFMLEAMALRRDYALTYPSRNPRLNQSTNSMNTPRAVGRVGLTMAWLGWAFPQHKAFLDELLVRRTDECIADQWAGRDIPEGLVRPLGVEKDQRMPKGNGWRPVFDSMGLIGLVAAHRAGSEAAASILVELVETILKYGLEPTLEPWWGVHFDASKPGQPVPSEPYNPTYFQWGEGRWGDWAGGGLKIAMGLLEQLGMTHLTDRIVPVLEAAVDRYSTGDAPDRIRHAEWIGAIPKHGIPVAE